MRKELLKYAFAFVGVAAVGFGALSVNAAGPVTGNPATLNTTADVDILQLITITEDQNLDFGTITKPSAGSTTYTVDLAGACTEAGSDGQCLAGSAQGIYDVTGTDLEPYTFTVSEVVAGCTNDPDVTLSLMTDDAGVALDDLNVNVGGTLTVASTAPDGLQGCAYTVTANY